MPPRDPAGTCAFLAMLLHALEIRDLRTKPSPPQFSMQWPYYILGFDILLFLLAGECPVALASPLPSCLQLRASLGELHCSKPQPLAMNSYLTLIKMK